MDIMSRLKQKCAEEKELEQNCTIQKYIKKCTVNGDTYENQKYRKEQGK